MMTRRKNGDDGDRGMQACREALEAHHATHGTIPSMAGLARLWSYASKSSASRRVDQLLNAGILVWSPDRRLAPGPAFRGAAPGDEGEGDKEEYSFVDALGEPEGPDALPAAIEAWAHDYDPVLVRSYSVTTRLLRLARSMERHMARSAAREGLTSGDVLLLDALHRVGPPHRIAPTALKHYFLMSLAGVAKRVDRLETAGFIERVPNPDDRRGLFIQLTEAGHQVLARLVAVDRSAPHILWPDALSETQYRMMRESLDIAERLVAIAQKKENDRS